MVVTRGHIPVFLWFLRTKYISKGEARSAFVASPWYHSGDPSETYQVTYEIRVMRESGKSVTLHEDEDGDVADQLAQRIREYGLEM
jgi:hypothetical protein